jgi:hypothetical protein
MKNLIHIFIALLISFYSFGQTKENIVDAYLNSHNNEVPTRLNHGPISLLLKGTDKASLFFISVFDSIKDNFELQGIVYYPKLGLYTEFYSSVFNPEFDKGVIAVFFENIDRDLEKELLFIVENSNRTFYSDGGYAGIKPNYQTRVFNLDLSHDSIKISEYKAIGELLTINGPMIMGRKVEEELIGRESTRIDEVLGVTKNAKTVKARIKMLKETGLLL